MTEAVTTHGPNRGLQISSISSDATSLNRGRLPALLQQPHQLVALRAAHERMGRQCDEIAHQLLRARPATVGPRQSVAYGLERRERRGVSRHSAESPRPGQLAEPRESPGDAE